MYGSRHTWLALLLLWPLSCKNTPNDIVAPTDASHPADHPVLTDGSGETDMVVDSGPQCKWPTALDNMGVAGCVPGRAFVTCTLPTSSSSYLASDPMGCVDCSGTCQDSCTLGEFAWSCSMAQPDAAVSAGPAHGCHPVFPFSSGAIVYCCPCQ